MGVRGGYGLFECRWQDGEEDPEEDETHSYRTREGSERLPRPGGSLGRGVSCTPVSGWGQEKMGHAFGPLDDTSNRRLRMARTAYCLNEVCGQSHEEVALESWWWRTLTTEVKCHAWSP